MNSLRRNLILSISSLSVATHSLAAISGDFTYVDNGSYITITDCSASGSVVIPSKINGKPVATIAGSTFFGSSNLTSVSIPDTVTRIEDYAFRGCSRLASVDIPSSVTHLGAGVFVFCDQLTSVTLREGLTSISQSTFLNCKMLSSVRLPTSLVTIETRAFGGCLALQSITLPPGLSTIDAYAFQTCGLASIEFPTSLTTIGAGAFLNCNQIKSVRIPDSVTSLEAFAFTGCDSMADVVLPDGLMELSEGLFRECPLESITIPDSVEVIGPYCFLQCNQLRKVVLPASLKRVERDAFFGCDSLLKLRFPSSLIKLDATVFSQSGVREILFDGKAPTIEDETFDGAKKNLKVFYRDGQKGFAWPEWAGLPAVPLGAEIMVSVPRNNPITKRVSTQYFGALIKGYQRGKTFTVHNIGTKTLKGLSTRVLNNPDGDFTCTAPLRKSLEPGKSTAFRVQFQPTDDGRRHAILQIRSNDSNEDPIIVKVHGLGMK